MTIINWEERVKVAYKKLKQMVYYEKHPLSLRRRLAEFECDDEFEGRLDLLAQVIQQEDITATEEFASWIADVCHEVIPKGAQRRSRDSSDGNFVTNYTSAETHTVSKVNYLFDGPVELHLLSVMWLMIEGPYYDRTLSEHCLGSRLHEFVGDDKDHSGYLFKKYHELYAKWRDSGIEKARGMLTKEHQSVCLVGLDVQEYYYRIELDWKLLREQIRRRKPTNPIEKFFMEEQMIGERLFRCIEAICKAYRDRLRPLLAITHPGLPDAATVLPIGLSASPVIANWYLKAFDQEVLENVRPAYYGRYVDDILMVIPVREPPPDADPVRNLLERVLVKTGVIAPKPNDAKGGRFEICCRPGLYLQQDKCVLQFFDSEHSAAGLEKFQKQLEENASAFALLPVEEDESPVAQVAYDLLYDGSVNKFRSVKAIAENRWALAGHLAKQTQLHLMTDGDMDPNLRDELFKFFKGRNAIDYWDLWERVIAFFVVADGAEWVLKFRNAIWNEIARIRFGSPNAMESESDDKEVTRALRETLVRHLDLSISLSMAVTGVDEIEIFHESKTWRESNLIRHHLVAVPLLNYTKYTGNYANPDEAFDLAIERCKAERSPRFVHFDECLGFASSDCAKPSKKDLIVTANEIYEEFHGEANPDVSSKSARRVTK
jgi:hypothetical protein